LPCCCKARACQYQFDDGGRLSAVKRRRRGLQHRLPFAALQAHSSLICCNVPCIRAPRLRMAGDQAVSIVMASTSLCRIALPRSDSSRAKVDHQRELTRAHAAPARQRKSVQHARISDAAARCVVARVPASHWPIPARVRDSV
jgi:hypothetical protein